MIPKKPKRFMIKRFMIKRFMINWQNTSQGTRWEGQFSMTGVKGNQTETYEIIKAEKGAKGDYWNLIARIKYGGKDATLPLPPIEIKFAGGNARNHRRSSHFSRIWNI